MSTTEPRIPGIHFPEEPIWVPDEPQPFNRRVYHAATRPFAWTGKFLWWASLPWRIALVLALVAAIPVGLFTDALAGLQGNPTALAIGILYIAGYWAAWLGAGLAAVMGLLNLIRR